MSPKDPRAHRGPCQPCRRSRLLVSPLPTPSVPTPLPTAALPYWSATSPSTGAPAPLAAFGVHHIVGGVVVGLPSFSQGGGCRGADSGADREGLRSAFSIAACLAPGVGCGSVVSLQALLPHLSRVLWVLGRCKCQGRGVLRSLFPCYWMQH